MTHSLPDWYPLANATDEQIDAWLRLEQPPYEEMREALPWLSQLCEFDAWIASMRDLKANVERGTKLSSAFPKLASIPSPPRRLAGRNLP